MYVGRFVMKLKTRLIIAFFVITLVPFLLFGVAFFGVSQYQIHMVEQSYGIQVELEDFSDSMQLIGKSTQSIFDVMKMQAANDPERFLDTEYLDVLNSSLTEKESWLLVRLNDEIYYNGSDKQADDVEKLFQELPAFRSFSSSSDGGSYIGKDIQAFIKQLDIEMENQSEVSIFIVSSADKIISHTRKLI
jgi:hypothetical protein